MEKRQEASFFFGFSPDDSISLPQCGTVPLFTGTEAEGIDGPPPAPPFWMISYPDGGIPIVSPVGDDPESLSWQVPHAQGSVILLNLVDSNGNSGGIPNKTYRVAAGSSSSCLSNTTPSLKAEYRLDSNLDTCGTLPILISGGTKPYTVTFAPSNGLTTVNATMGSEDDFYEYVNNSPPGTLLYAAISDSTGQYASGSRIITTTGGTDTSCPGRVSRSSIFDESSDGSSGTASGSNPSGTDTPSTEPPSRRIPIGAIIGSIVGIILLFGLIAYIFFRRRNGQKVFDTNRFSKARESRVDLDEVGYYAAAAKDQPYAFTGPASQVAGYVPAPTQSPSTAFRTFDQPHQQQQQVYQQQPYSSYPPNSYPPSSRPYSFTTDGYNPPSPLPHPYTSPSVTPSQSSARPLSRATDTSSAPSVSVQPSAARAKALEARSHTIANPDPVVDNPYRGPVYQHEDAGDVMELPPAYRDFNSRTPGPA